MNRPLVLKAASVVTALLVTLAGIFYGDVTPVIRDICEAALPSGTLIHEVDAGAAR